MNRDEMVSRLKNEPGLWDVIVIGGGATGLGVAIDAASRGYRTMLVEQSDFAKGTSSRSTKLVHGGVRYLQQGNVSLVLEALHERSILRENAPHLVHDLPFVVPNYDWWEGPFYGIGLRVYDLLAGKHGFGRSRNLSIEETVERIPTIETEGLRGGVVYYDGQFDDARLAINMAQTAAEQGAAPISYMKVTSLIKEGGTVTGVQLRDEETGDEYTSRAKVVVNATGVFTDNIRHLDDPAAPTMISPSQGAHIVLDRSFMPGDSAIMVPHTDDGRVLFAVPWHDRVIVGTTDTPVDEVSLEPRPLDEELDFLLVHAARYLTKDPTPDDVLSAFAGLRPLVKAENGENTATLSRDHTIIISRSGLLTITGGKWTTYRRMAQDTVDQAAVIGGLEESPCSTETLRIHGYHKSAESFGTLAVYGEDATKIEALIQEVPRYADQLHDDSPVVAAQVVWAVRHEMARTLEDVLARRTRCLILDARQSIEMAPKAAALMAEELGRDEAWQHEQIRAYTELARGYLLR